MRVRTSFRGRQILHLFCIKKCALCKLFWRLSRNIVSFTSAEPLVRSIQSAIFCTYCYCWLSDSVFLAFIKMFCWQSFATQKGCKRFYQKGFFCHICMKFIFCYWIYNCRSSFPHLMTVSERLIEFHGSLTPSALWECIRWRVYTRKEFPEGYFIKELMEACTESLMSITLFWRP